jgi:hypothetical protein
MGAPAVAHDKTECRRPVPRAVHIGFRPLETAKERQYSGHYILRRVIGEQELRFKQLIEIAALVAHRIAITCRARKAGLCSLSTFRDAAQAMWPVAVMTPSKHRMSSGPDTALDAFHFKEIFRRYYELIQEIANEEINYTYEVLNVARRRVEAPMVGIDHFFRVLG